MGSGTVQYMEINAINRFLDSLDENELKGGGLGFDTLRTADIFALTMNRVILARNEKLIRMACTGLLSEASGDDVKAVSAHLLSALWDVESARGLILSHVRVTDLARQYVKQVNTREYTESMHLLLSAAFATRTPSASEAEKEERLANQRQSMRQALPLITLAFLEKITSDVSSHRDVVENGVLEATMKMMSTVGVQLPIGSLLLANLSTSEFGRQALLQHQVPTFIIDIASNSESPLHSAYNDPVSTNFAPLHFQAVLSNLYHSNLRQLALEAPLYINSLTDIQKNDIQRYNLESSIFNQRLMHISLGMLFAFGSGLLWGGARGIARNYWRMIGYSTTGAAFQGAARAAIGAPLLVGSAYAALEWKNSLIDDRLFITWSILSTTAVVFGLNFLLAAAPFSAAPALLGAYASHMPSYAERNTKEQQLSEFKQHIKERNQPNASISQELEESLKNGK